ncbi:MAG: serine/threonine protein kinase, partial [Planctomycetes bacterium]|nr:serine/threonine protein kinase [Planctomycetota bacterium]
MIRSGWHFEPQLRARFQSEIATVASLGHPNIVQVYEVGEQNGYDFFSMEFMSGGRLDEKVGTIPQPAREAAQLVAQLADAVQFAHEHRVIHRDLKPSNILLSEDGAPKIADFGLAKRLEVETGTTTAGGAIGTPCYMAPEQAAGQVGPAGDIYSLGAILYELLTGRPPHHGVTPMHTLQQVTTLEPVPPSRLQPQVPRDLETICLKCLQKQPHQRYADARGLADDLRRFLAGEPIAARPIRFWERALKWARRRPAWAALIVVSTLATLTFAGAGWWSSARLRTLSFNLQVEAELARLQARTADAARREAKRRAEQAIRAGLEADEQRRRATEQRQLADANFRQASDVLDRFVELSQDPRLQTDELLGLRTQMRQTALAFYDGLVQQRSNDPEVLAEQGRTLGRIARITSQTGNKAEAVKLCQQAIAIFEELAAAHTENAAYDRELALSLYSLA